jgi:hypothetical protein
MHAICKITGRANRFIGNLSYARRIAANTKFPWVGIVPQSSIDVIRHNAQ